MLSVDIDGVELAEHPQPGFALARYPCAQLVVCGAARPAPQRRLVTRQRLGSLDRGLFLRADPTREAVDTASSRSRWLVESPEVSVSRITRAR